MNFNEVPPVTGHYKHAECLLAWWFSFDSIECCNRFPPVHVVQCVGRPHLRCVRYHAPLSFSISLRLFPMPTCFGYNVKDTYWPIVTSSSLLYDVLLMMGSFVTSGWVRCAQIGRTWGQDLPLPPSQISEGPDRGPTISVSQLCVNEWKIMGLDRIRPYKTTYIINIDSSVYF